MKKKFKKISAMIMAFFMIVSAIFLIVSDNVEAAGKTWLCSELSDIVAGLEGEGPVDTDIVLYPGDIIKNDLGGEIEIYIDSKEFHETQNGPYTSIEIGDDEQVTLKLQYKSDHNGNNVVMKTLPSKGWHLYRDEGGNVAFFCPISQSEANTGENGSGSSGSSGSGPHRLTTEEIAYIQAMINMAYSGVSPGISPETIPQLLAGVPLEDLNRIFAGMPPEVLNSILAGTYPVAASTPPQTSPETSPKTGENSSTYVFVLMALAMIGIVRLVFIKKRYNH